MRAPSPRRRSRGVGLIEVLITVLLLSIGFLAAATMQVSGMRASQGAYFQSQAYFLVTEMMDRMRANVRGLELGAYDALQTDAEAVDPGCAAKSCTATELAAQDRYDWSARLHPLGGATNFVPALPAAEDSPPIGTVTRLSPGLYRVRLTWDELHGGDTERQTLDMHLVAEAG